MYIKMLVELNLDWTIILLLYYCNNISLILYIDFCLFYSHSKKTNSHSKSYIILTVQFTFCSNFCVPLSFVDRLLVSILHTDFTISPDSRTRCPSRADIIRSVLPQLEQFRDIVKASPNNGAAILSSTEGTEIAKKICRFLVCLELLSEL